MLEENIKTYILDSSFMLSFFLPDEQVDTVNSIFKQYIEGKINFVSCVILPFEVANGLKEAVIRKRINQKTAYFLINDFLDYSIKFMDVDFKTVMSLSLKEDMSVYDACYLYLAKKENLKLLTLDEKLKEWA